MDQAEKTVNCRTMDNQVVVAPLSALIQSNTFNQMFEHSSCDLDQPTLEFLVPAMNADVFVKVLEWCNAHVGLSEPVVRENDITKERTWFEMTDEEKKFFEMGMKDLRTILNAANYLDIKSLLLYGCQAFAHLIKNAKNAQEIRDMLELEDDMTEEEKEAVQREYFGPVSE